MHKLLMIALAASTAMAGAAHAQAYDGPRPAYAAAGWSDDDGCRGGRFTLAGAHAGVTVLGVDVGASAGLHVGLHDRCRGGGRPVVYAPAPAGYAPQPYGPTSYGQDGGYGQAVGYPDPAYAAPAYPPPAYGQVSGYGYGYAAPTGYGYGPPPCGC